MCVQKCPWICAKTSKLVTPYKPDIDRPCAGCEQKMSWVWPSHKPYVDGHKQDVARPPAGCGPATSWMWPGHKLDIWPGHELDVARPQDDGDWPRAPAMRRMWADHSIRMWTGHDPQSWLGPITLHKNMITVAQVLRKRFGGILQNTSQILLTYIYRVLAGIRTEIRTEMRTDVCQACC